jgi:signal peptidase II
MTPFARLAVLLVTMIGCVGCDQVTKAAARTYLDTGTTMSFFNDTVRLQHAENPGGFLSIGESLPVGARTILFTFGGAALVAGSILWVIRSRRVNTIQTIGAALACSGGVGNLIDRFSRHGHVTDFLNVGIGPLRTGIFNVADFALLVGVALLVLSSTGGEPKRQVPGLPD